MIMKRPASAGNKRYVIYTRCSTDDQAQGDYTTLDAQAHHCKNMLDAFGYTTAKIGKNGVVKDDGYSGKDLNRPGIQAILKDLNTKKSFDGIIFFQLDRLTRNPKDLYSMIDMFRNNGIDFISVRENLDSSTAIGRVVIGIIGLLSAFERELTGERVKAATIARVRQGIWPGGTVPYGYKLIDDGDPLPNGRQPHKLVIVKEVAPYLKLIWQMAAQNTSLGEIVHELRMRGFKTTTGKNWRIQGISKIIKNPFYKGYIKYGGEVHKGQHPAIIDEPTWEKANKILSARLPKHRFSPKPRDYMHKVAGLIKCGLCGSHMVCTHSAGRRRGKYFYYECSRARQNMGCSAERLPAKIFDQAIIDYLTKVAENQEIITQAIGNAILDSQIKLESIEKALAKKSKELTTLRNKTQKLLDLALNGTIAKGTTYTDKMLTLEANITRIEYEIEKLIKKKRISHMNAHSGRYLHENIKFVLKNMDKSSPESQVDLIKALVKNITVYEDKVAINMHIQEPIQNTQENTPQKNGHPTGKGEMPYVNQSVSTGTPHWRLVVDARRTSQVIETSLLIKLYKKRSMGALISLGKPIDTSQPYKKGILSKHRQKPNKIPVCV